MKILAQNWLPPSVFRWIHKKVRRCRECKGFLENSINFEGDFATWEEASAHCTGYDDSVILAKVLESTLKVKRGEAAYERDSVIFDRIEYAWPVLAGIMWTAASNGGRLNVLDFGGSLGSSYFENRKFLKSLIEVRWNVVEQSHYVEAGRANIQDEQLRFYKSIEVCLRENQPNIILLSSVLQYLKDPEEIINKVIVLNADVVILDRTIINQSAAHKIYVQHVPASIYSATYPCRSLSEPLLLKSLGNTYRLAVDFASLEFPALHAIDSEFKGYIFERIVK